MKTHIAKQTKKYPNHRLLVHNLRMKKEKKKGRYSFRWLEGSALSVHFSIVSMFFIFLYFVYAFFL